MKPDEGKSSIASALARKAMRITTHDDGLIKKYQRPHRGRDDAGLASPAGTLANAAPIELRPAPPPVLLC